MPRYAAHREVAAGELAVVPIAHALFRGVHARVLVRADRPLAAAPSELLAWILQRMTMFGGAAVKPPPRRRLKDQAGFAAAVETDTVA